MDFRIHPEGPEVLLDTDAREFRRTGIHPSVFPRFREDEELNPQIAQITQMKTSDTLSRSAQSA